MTEPRTRNGKIDGAVVAVAIVFTSLATAFVVSGWQATLVQLGVAVGSVALAIRFGYSPTELGLSRTDWKQGLLFGVAASAVVAGVVLTAAVNRRCALRSGRSNPIGDGLERRTALSIRTSWRPLTVWIVGFCGYRVVGTIRTLARVHNAWRPERQRSIRLLHRLADGRRCSRRRACHRSSGSNVLAAADQVRECCGAVALTRHDQWERLHRRFSPGDRVGEVKSQTVGGCR